MIPSRKRATTALERVKLGAQDGISRIPADHEVRPGQRGAVRPTIVFETHGIFALLETNGRYTAVRNLHTVLDAGVVK